MRCFSVSLVLLHLCGTGLSTSLSAVDEHYLAKYKSGVALGTLTCQCTRDRPCQSAFYSAALLRTRMSIQIPCYDQPNHHCKNHTDKLHHGGTFYCVGNSLTPPTETTTTETTTTETTTTTEAALTEPLVFSNASDVVESVLAEKQAKSTETTDSGSENSSTQILFIATGSCIAFAITCFMIFAIYKYSTRSKTGNANVYFSNPEYGNAPLEHTTTVINDAYGYSSNAPLYDFAEETNVYETIDDPPSDGYMMPVSDSPNGVYDNMPTDDTSSET